MRRLTGTPRSSVENGSTAGSTAGELVRLDATLLQPLQWSDLPAFDALVDRCNEADEGWTLHTLSRSLFNWPVAEDRALIGLSDQGGQSGLSDVSYVSDQSDQSGQKEAEAKENGEDGGSILLGVAGLAPDPRHHHEAHLSLLVDPSHRGRGVGRQLLDAIMRIAVARGYESASARTRADNGAFIHLMIQHDFTPSSHPGTEPILLSRPLDGVRS